MANLIQCLRPWWLTGPIFDKEMRVSSRRRRNYVLRFIYIGLFTLMATVLWIDRVANTTSSGYTSVYQVSRMAAAGQVIITAVLWFQFLTAQVIAVVMLSTSISDEIYKRTLGVLMTTPIGSFQIVVGKLLSKLLQIVLLLAISLPLLAIVRVFGGVPWGYLLCGLCVTLTTIVFVGSLSLFFSIFTRRAYTVIIEAILALGFLFGFLPLVMAYLMLSGPGRSPGSYMAVQSHINPYFMMSAATTSLYTARPAGMAMWPQHCAVMLGASSLLLLLAIVFVRKAALRQAVGQRTEGRRQRTENRGQSVALIRHLSSVLRPPVSVRRVVGPPVLWKERRIPLLGRRRALTIVAMLAAVGLLVLVYGISASEGMLGEQDVQVAYGIVYFSLGILITMVVPATCITSEKESQTWSLLLTTTVGDWEILGGKFLGALRRCAPAWLLLFAHVIVFAIGQIVHPIAIIQFGLLAAWVAIFLTGTGLYFSTRFKHTTTAVIANMGLAAGLWAVFPLLAAITLEVFGGGSDFIEVYMDANPFVHAAIIMMATARSGGLGPYEWVQGGMASLPDATGWMALNFCAYGLVGLGFVTRAAARLRLNPV
jgi:ABC-type transport system involved in multi-copper enzyme maturation permease subunit